MDIVPRSGWIGHVEAQWEIPGYARFLRRLATFGRVITFDVRGTGMSDPVPLTSPPTLEEWMDDARAVLDDASAERAAFIAVTNTGPMAMLFAATYPDRTSALVLINSYARLTRTDDYPEGAPPNVIEDAVRIVREKWGRGTLAALAPARERTAEVQAALSRFERHGAAPGAAATHFRLNFEVDVRDVLPAIRAPTLVMHGTQARFFRIQHGRYIADHIPDARFVEIIGADEFLWHEEDLDRIMPDIQEFLTGVRPMPEPDRVLATVMFTDLVRSTERVAELGDQRWKDLLLRHREIVRRELGNHRGREINTAGDGFLATYDGPARAIHCAQAIADRNRAIGLDVRAGLHTGECELMGEDVGGIAVHIAARVAALAAANEVLVSSTVKDLVAGSGIGFVERGTHKLKGVPDEWRLFAVEA
jgi:class 3 adenylate cyclase